MCISDSHRELNAHYYDAKMEYFKTVNLGMAVDTDRGLMVPTIFGADSMTLNELAVASKALAAECNKGTINPDLLKGGTFTVSNPVSYTHLQIPVPPGW